MRARRGQTLLELLVAMAVLGLLVTLLWRSCAAAQRRAAQLERVGDGLRAVELLRAALVDDLDASLPLAVLGASRTPEEVEATTLELPVAAGYQGDAPQALRFRRVVYAFDPARGLLLRDGRPLVSTGLSGVSFRWSAERPTRLLVELRGAGPHPSRESLALPAPAGTDALDGWIPARHHRGALEVSSEGR